MRRQRMHGRQRSLHSYSPRWSLCVVWQQWKLVCRHLLFRRALDSEPHRPRNMRRSILGTEHGRLPSFQRMGQGLQHLQRTHCHHPRAWRQLRRGPILLRQRGRLHRHGLRLWLRHLRQMRAGCQLEQPRIGQLLERAEVQQRERWPLRGERLRLRVSLQLPDASSSGLSE